MSKWSKSGWTKKTHLWICLFHSQTSLKCLNLSVVPLKRGDSWELGYLFLLSDSVSLLHLFVCLTGSWCGSSVRSLGQIPNWTKQLLSLTWRTCPQGQRFQRVLSSSEEPFWLGMDMVSRHWRAERSVLLQGMKHYLFGEAALHNSWTWAPSAQWLNSFTRPFINIIIPVPTN